MSAGGFIYAIGIEGQQLVKIGKTSRAVADRLYGLQVNHHMQLAIRAAVLVEEDLGHIEKTIHSFLESEKQRGEWFAVSMDQHILEALVLRALAWIREEKIHEDSVIPQAPGETKAQIGDRVRAARLRHGMSGAELARRVHLTRQQLSMIERNKTTNPGVLTVEAIADTLRVSIDYLLGREELESETRPAALDLIGV